MRLTLLGCALACALGTGCAQLAPKPKPAAAIPINEDPYAST
jgi:hypothetical protein